ncbi:alternative thymidylate synthase [Thermoanaerobacterium thermosaccharolyticum]|uniref:Thymidylate synthase complementing protein ThyX n=2 Tax=Thermoanaerobacterium thermosaccharolyticum TaxID=1517 RepID=D9TSE4_THETC|nr:FAD-dependent thymidylate synthase [Thermoanaerobacterium thermosaccharolyticum]ADL68042.1 thymidylate synthase complementing protein ThyX [Thermoanaerobacterium thermosaccharolyticum DSM 571]AST57974.1 thymidylate synthase complementing protein [Thermoanaerobacterium thermosaccharolyticum]MCP2240214.1 thymidylate synthase ThyX [Thermoanaerobacterium thermosaccharolyticum]PHO06656.1 alternative thymidylate synthase [Thermoanaerobacterium thermosaccharolyticum]
MLMRKLTEGEERLLKKFVTNLYGPVYFIHSLPEFIIPPINSKVSRKDTSWRLNILESLTSGDLDINDFLTTSEIPMDVAIKKAKAFHEKWVEKFGHSSIAEQNLMHLCIEDTSRYLSGDIELMNKRPSFIEWSQRYQRPTRDRFIIPPELDDYPDLKGKFIKVWNISFDAYETLVAELTEFLKSAVERNEHESDKAYINRISKIAFEDARYALLLSAKTSFAVALNALDLQDIIRKLQSHGTKEAEILAENIINEAEKIAPSMMRHLSPSKYQLAVNKDMEKIAKGYNFNDNSETSDVELIDYTGKNGEMTFLDILTMHILFSYTGKPIDGIIKTVKALSREEKAYIVESAASKMDQFDHLIEPFRAVRYKFQLKVSEAAWHQLLRHRMINFNAYKPTVENGYTVPPNVEKAGCVDVLKKAIDESEKLYMELSEKLPNVCHYVVTNAHRRIVLMDADLWAFDHFANLRCTPEAQWDIRSISYKMLDLIKEQTPEVSKFLARRKQS